LYDRPRQLDALRKYVTVIPNGRTKSLGPAGESAMRCGHADTRGRGFPLSLYIPLLWEIMVNVRPHPSARPQAWVLSRLAAPEAGFRTKSRLRRVRAFSFGIRVLANAL